MARPKKQVITPPVPSPEIEITSERPTVRIRNNMPADFHSGSKHVFPSGEAVELSNDDAAQLMQRPVEAWLLDSGKLEIV